LSFEQSFLDGLSTPQPQLFSLPKRLFQSQLEASLHNAKQVNQSFITNKSSHPVATTAINIDQYQQ
jgi:hypothetical protein